MAISKNTMSTDFQLEVYNLLTSNGYTVVPIEDEDILNQDYDLPHIAYSTGVNYKSNTLKYARLAEGEIMLMIADDDFRNVKELTDSIMLLFEGSQLSFTVTGYNDNYGDFNTKSKLIYFNRMIIGVEIDGYR